MDRLKLWAPVILWMTAIIVVSSLPGERLPEINLPNIDKIAHFIEYAILGFLLSRAVSGSGAGMKRPAVLFISAVTAVIFAVLDEWRQGFVPGRDTDMIDFMFDLMGGVTGALMYEKKWKKKQI